MKLRWGIGFGAEKIGLAVLYAPKTALLLVGALIILIGLSLPRVTFDTDIHRVFLSDSPLSRAQLDYENSLSPITETILIRIAASDRFEPEELSAIRNLSLDLELLPGVTSVASPFVLRLPQPDGKAAPVFQTTIGTDYIDRLSQFDDLATGLPTLINAARDAALLAVRFDTSAAQVTEILGDIEQEITGTIPHGLDVDITGETVISAEVVAGLKAELISLNLWGALIISATAFLLLRDLRMTILAVVPSILGTLGVVSLSVWLGYPITVLNNVIPILLLVLGVADGVHLTGHLKVQRRAEHALRHTLQDIGPACALTALTTAAAFASISLTANEQLFEFAILGSLGTLLSFVISISVFTLLGRFIKPTERPLPATGRRFSAILAGIGTRHARGVLVWAVVILLISTTGYFLTKPWFPLHQNLPSDSTTVATNDRIAADFGGVFQLVVEVDGGWSDLVRVAKALESEAPYGSVFSELSLARYIGKPTSQPSPETLSEFPKTATDALRPLENVSRIFVSVPEPMRNIETLTQFDRLTSAARAAGASQIIGLPAVMRTEAVTLISQLSRALVIAALGATALVALAFRSLQLVPILLVPNILPLMLTGATLHFWAAGQLTPTSVLALTIAFGIAIDDTIHYLSRVMVARKQGFALPDALVQATRSAGQMMFLTTVLLTAGLAVTLASDFTPVRIFGGMMIVTLWAALLVDLLLLPALLSLKGDKNA